MKTINIIGFGNVAFHFIQKINTLPNYKLQQVLVRNKKNAKGLLAPDQIVTQIEQLQVADLTIISVADDAIKEVAEAIPYKNKLIVHTSGTTSMEVLKTHDRRGVFYPLQTFSKSREVNFQNIPLCLETNNENDWNELKALASQMSEKVYKISSEQRRSLHVAAVFVSNFTNHMYTIGNEICEENKVPFEVLHPLIEETAAKIKTLPPLKAQTGPAIRHDEVTLKTHQDFLKNETYKNIYKTITESIQNV